jgi:hypothetical protein
MPGTSPALEALVKALELFNAVKPVLDTALQNEAERVGLTREERHALTKRLTGETDAITKEDMGTQA